MNQTELYIVVGLNHYCSIVDAMYVAILTLCIRQIRNALVKAIMKEEENRKLYVILQDYIIFWFSS